MATCLAKILVGYFTLVPLIAMGDDKLNDPFSVGDEPLDFSGAAESTASIYKLENEEILKLSEKAENGDADSAFRLYQYYKFIKLDIIKTKKWLQKAADQGHEIAKKNLKHY